MVHSFESAWFAWDFPGFIPHLRNPSVQGKVEKCVTILGNYPRLGKHYDGFWLLVFTSFRFKSNIFPFGTSNNEAQNMSTHSDFPTSGFSFLFFFFCCCCSATKSCPTLCDPMDCSTSGLPVLHHLTEFAQIHIQLVGDAL